MRIPGTLRFNRWDTLRQSWRRIVRRAGRGTITDESEIQISAERDTQGDSNNDRQSSFAPSLLFIDPRSLIAVSDVSRHSPPRT